MKLKVITHSGQDHEIDVGFYDAAALNQQLNDGSVYTILIGNMIFSRIDIKYVGPVEVP